MTAPETEPPEHQNDEDQQLVSSSTDDPRETDHPTGVAQAVQNAEDEPAG